MPLFPHYALQRRPRLLSVGVRRCACVCSRFVVLGGTNSRPPGGFAMAHEVFLSYASADEDIVEVVCDALERRAVRCWLAPRDMAPGIHYAEGILKAINHCRLVVLILSAN